MATELNLAREFPPVSTSEWEIEPFDFPPRLVWPGVSRKTGEMRGIDWENCNLAAPQPQPQ